MIRHEWHTLPVQVRDAVQGECGEVVKIETPTAGRNSDFAATLHLADHRRVFCKGVMADSPAAPMQRTEARVAPWLPAPAPRLLWEVEAKAWVLLGFEHVTGEHADLSPGSPALPLIADAVSVLARELTPYPAVIVPALGGKMARMSAWQRLRDNPPDGLDDWSRANLDRFAGQERTAIELVTGNTLLHTDLHSLNILVGPGSARVVDWAWAHVGAVWADAAYLTIRLIEEGHTPEQAEQWMATTVAWAEASPATLTAFAIEVFGMWEYLRHAMPLPVRERAARAAQEWARYRLGIAAAFVRTNPAPSAR